MCAKLQPRRDTNTAVLHRLPLHQPLWRELLLGELPDEPKNSSAESGESCVASALVPIAPRNKQTAQPSPAPGIFLRGSPPVGQVETSRAAGCIFVVPANHLRF